MLNFHIDVWTPNVTTFKIKIVDFGSDGSYQGGDDKEFSNSYIDALFFYDYFLLHQIQIMIVIIHNRFAFH